MSTKNTTLKKTTPAGDSNTTHGMVIAKSNAYQRPLLIVAGTLRALPVLIVVTGKSGVHHFKPSAHEIVQAAGAVAD